MLVIRLARTGRKNQPCFRMLVQEKHRAPRGRHLEIVGSFEPRDAKKTMQLKKDRIQHWLSVGAQPSARVHNIFVDNDILKTKKIRATTIKQKKRNFEEKKHNIQKQEGKKE